MSQFDDRKRGQEAKFQLDQELEFKAQARRAKFVGQWAAPFLLFGFYNKLVKTGGSDRTNK